MLRRFLLPSFLLVAAGLAMAQQPRPRGTPIEMVTKFLDLSDAQVGQIKDLFEKRRAETAPLRETLKQEIANLRELVKGAAPNPTQVGQAYLRVHELKQELAAAREAFRESFAAILTPEQKAKLKAVQRGGQVIPFLHAFRRLGID